MDTLKILPENWQEQAQQYWLNNDYNQASKLYELGVELEPENLSYYGKLGVLFLLQEQETEAQTTWLTAMSVGEEEEIEIFTQELLGILENEAERQEDLQQDSIAWIIRQHLREINPLDLHNLLHLIALSVTLNMYTGEELETWGVLELLRESPPRSIDFNLLMEVLRKILEYNPFIPSNLDLAESCIPQVENIPIFLELMLKTAVRVDTISSVLAVRFCEIARLLDSPELDSLTRLSVFNLLANFYQNARQYDQGIEIAKLAYHSIAQSVSDKLIATHKLLRGLMGAVGYWSEVKQVMKEQEDLFNLIIEQQPTNLDPYQVLSLFTTRFFLPYYQDNLELNRKFLNEISALCQKNMSIYAREKIERYQARHLLKKQEKNRENRRLKIGYLAHCFHQHSVGWLARWLFHHHHRERFHIHGYFVAHRVKPHPDFLEDWYLENTETFRQCGFNTEEIAEQIYEDDLDILIDLDSITLDLSCEIVAFKPAPIQVTWLGWDGLGTPAIDYFIADPYVLPECAQDYYQETIWRLPETYIAVDGFEVAIPTLRREDLGIESDAIIYLSSQVGYKRHPDTVRLQMKILAQVSGSYFLLKGSHNDPVVKNYFYELAKEQGVSPDRLKFLPLDPSENIHRANLMIADVVLDTYPYNGATTTLETLWMGIPLVTKVGKQFSARNSYTMMINAGINEGIAWTDEEYIEWGIRLGNDENLRQQVTWKLIQSRYTSPLWNGKRFTQEMEKAYEKMWEIFVNS